MCMLPDSVGMKLLPHMDTRQPNKWFEGASRRCSAVTLSTASAESGVDIHRNNPSLQAEKKGKATTVASLQCVTA